MKIMNVLVTGIGGPTAQGIMQGLLDKENVRIVGADRRSITSGNQFCEKVYQIPALSETEQYQRAILGIVEEEDIDAIFPALHEEIEVYESFRERVPSKVALPKAPLFDILINKESVYHYLKEIGLNQHIPEYYGFSRSEELREIINECFPNETYTVVKQLNGHGSLGFAILADRDNFLKALKNDEKKVVNI
ncbi:hypothetical protein [Alteribacillus sp. HJP-4]|uniref:hypothetical protein n=1 Tax=Alteribacillus sp. HJP-4 TaxID=2775394 RepID=UPI0035CD3026